eukprot:maker-scaffold_5-snap-gene-10.60-mRNA-1 protein AED:0.26 eAED:0.26 QI:128/1/1/1/1/1/4/49/87
MSIVPVGRPYTVTDPNPDVGTVIANYSAADWGYVGLFTGTSTAYGLYTAFPRSMIRPHTIAATVIGGVGGFVYAYQRSAGRLMGFRK